MTLNDTEQPSSLGESPLGSFNGVIILLKPYFETPTDERVEDWLLMKSFTPTLLLTMSYLLVVTIGPQIMENRSAFSLRRLIVLYNLFLILLSTYMFSELLLTTFLNPSFDLVCQSVDASTDEMPLRLASAIWWFYFSKLIEFVDTFIFVLRKKNSQITFLHVYHHTTMPLLWWVGARYLPGGSSYLSALMNSGVHILMYFYYMLSAMGPHMQKYLWWKRYMTIIQLAQFWIGVAHGFAIIYCDCGYPIGYAASVIFYMTSHILLFSNFYSKKYNKDKKDNSRTTTFANGHHKLE